MGILFLAAFLNRASHATGAARMVFVGALLTATTLVFEARDGFRSHAMLAFPGLLLLSVMFMDRRSYTLTAAIVLFTVAGLGIADKSGYMRAIPGVRSPTTYDSIFSVDLLLLVIALIGSRIARNTHSNVLDLNNAIAQASQVNLELRETAEAWREKQQELVSIYNTVHDVIFRLAVEPDGRFRFVSVNTAFLRVTGLSLEAVVGKTVNQVIPEPSLTTVLRKCQEALGQKIMVSWEETTDFPTGRLTGEVTIAPVFDERGSCSSLVGSLHDITERKNAEAALRESEERFRRVFEEGPLGLALVGRNYRFSQVNRALCQMVGYSEAELVQMSFPEITYPDDREKDVPLAERLFSGELASYGLEKRYIKKNGEIIWINLTASLLRNHRGEAVHGLAMIEDITEIKRNREEAFARQKLESVGLLARGIAHDFNNLLGGVVAETEVAEMELNEGEFPIESIRRIRSVATRGAEIVRELMIYSGQDDDDPLEAIDISTLVREMGDLLKTSIPKNVLLDIDLPKNLPAVMGKASQLRQVVMNLIINAAEAIGDKGGMIRIAASRAKPPGNVKSLVPRRLNSAEYLKVEVRDTGVGMTEQIKAKVFDPFFSTKSTGRGMGLAILERVIRDHEGRICLESAPGEGTKFEIFLPTLLEKTHPRHGPAGRVPAAAHRTAPRTVLIVEDEDVLRRAITRLLRKNRFDVIEAADGSAGLQLVRSGAAIDLLLLDMSLPGVSSREVLDEVHRLRPNLKVIVTSAYNRETVDEFFGTGRIERFIRKPFELSQLLAVLDDALRVRQSENQY
jgi:PAS domain S-box-containing protein